MEFQQSGYVRVGAGGAKGKYNKNVLGGWDKRGFKSYALCGRGQTSSSKEAHMGISWQTKGEYEKPNPGGLNKRDCSRKQVLYGHM